MPLQGMSDNNDDQQLSPLPPPRGWMEEFPPTFGSKRREREWDNDYRGYSKLGATSFSSLSCFHDRSLVRGTKLIGGDISSSAVHFPAVISQEDDEEEATSTGMDTDDNNRTMMRTAKRFRAQDWGLASHSFSCDSHRQRIIKCKNRNGEKSRPRCGSDPNRQEKTSTQSEAASVEWWKQKPTTKVAHSQSKTDRESSSRQYWIGSHYHNAKEDDSNPNSTSCCYVCRRGPLILLGNNTQTKVTHQQPQQDHTTDSHHKIKSTSHCPLQKNSLLSYFSTSSSSSLSCRDTSPTANDNSLISSITKLNAHQEEEFPNIAKCCIYCDRNVCSTCTRRCEACQDIFCAFCSTINYSGKIERALCLDCDTEMGRSNNNNSMDDSDGGDAKMCDEGLSL